MAGAGNNSQALSAEATSLMANATSVGATLPGVGSGTARDNVAPVQQPRFDKRVPQRAQAQRRAGLPGSKPAWRGIGEGASAVRGRPAVWVRSLRCGKPAMAACSGLSAEHPR